MRNHFATVLIGLVAIALVAADASAMYHPTLGRFLQRDPVGYADGMSFYAYVSGWPTALLDPAGLRARSLPREWEPGLVPVAMPGLAEIADMALGLGAMLDAARVGARTAPGAPHLPPPRSGREFASYDYCCLCVDRAVHREMFEAKRGQAYMDKVRDPGIRTARDLRKAVDGEGGKGGILGPSRTVGRTGLFDSEIIPQQGPCADLMNQATAEHERSHWEDRNALLSEAQSGIRSISRVWGAPFVGGGDKYFAALSEAGASDAGQRFLDEFIEACRELGVGD